MADYKTLGIADSAPPSIKQDPRIVAVLEALDRELKGIHGQKGYLYIIRRLDELPEEIVDLLAWQWHVDFWEASLPVEIKRQLVKNSIPWHRKKGTAGVVKEMAATVLGEATVEEWFQYGGEPYFFRIRTGDNIRDGKVFERLIKIVNAVKNVRSWLEKITVESRYPLNLHWGAAVRDQGKIIVGVGAPPGQRARQTLYCGGSLYIREQERIDANG
jgi:phage tail P2-like protein